VGTSQESWEKAARTAVETAAQILRDLHIVEAVALDTRIDEGKVHLHLAKVKVSFEGRDLAWLELGQWSLKAPYARLDLNDRISTEGNDEPCVFGLQVLLPDCTGETQRAFLIGEEVNLSADHPEPQQI